MKIASSIKYPLLAAFIFIGSKLAVFFTHNQFTITGRYSGVIALALLSVPLALAIKDRRDNELNGFISLKQIMRTGLFVCVIASLIVALFNYIYFKYIDHEILSYYLIENAKSIRELNGSEEDIRQAREHLIEFYSPFSQAMGGLTGVLGVGAILSFFLSSFFIKKNPAAEN